MDPQQGQPELNAQQTRTILSVVQEFGSHDAFPSQSMHPFSAEPASSIAMLRELGNMTAQISSSLSALSTLPMANTKLFSLLKQHTTIAHTVNDVCTISYNRK